MNKITVLLLLHLYCICIFSQKNALEPEEYIFLKNWIMEQKVHDSVFNFFRESFPRSPHAHDSLEYQILINAHKLSIKDEMFTKKLIDETTQVFSSATLEQKQNMAYVWGILNAEKAIPLLFKMLWHDDLIVRKNAIFSLKFLGFRTVRLSYLLYGGNPAKFSSGKYKQDKAVQGFISTLSQFDCPSLPLLLEISSYYDVPVFTESLLNLAENEKAPFYIRQKALESLENMESVVRDELKRLQHLAKHNNSLVCSGAITALQKYGELEEVLELFLQGLESDEFLVRKTCFNCLDKLTHKKYTSLLHKYILFWLKSEDAEERKFCIKYIVGKPTVWGQDTILKVLQDPDIANRYIASGRLFWQGNLNALDVFIHLLTEINYKEGSLEEREIVDDVLSDLSSRIETMPDISSEKDISTFLLWYSENKNKIRWDSEKRVYYWESTMMIYKRLKLIIEEYDLFVKNEKSKYQDFYSEEYLVVELRESDYKERLNEGMERLLYLYNTEKDTEKKQIIEMFASFLGNECTAEEAIIILEQISPLTLFDKFEEIHPSWQTYCTEIFCVMFDEKNIEKEQLETFFIKLIKQTSSDIVLQCAAGAFAFVGTKKTLTLLRKMLSSNNPEVREMAVYALYHVSLHEEIPVETDIIPMLEDDDWRVKIQSARALFNLQIPISLISILKEGIHNEDDNIQYRAWNILNEMGTEALEITPHLLKLINNSNITEYTTEYTKGYAIETLGSIGNNSEEVISTLLIALQDDNLKRTTIQALGKLGTRTDVVVSSLLKFVQKSNPFCLDAIEALRNLEISDERFVTALIPLLEDEELNVRHEAIVIMQLGNKAQKAIPALLEGLKRNDYYYRGPKGGNYSEKYHDMIRGALENIQKQDR